MRSDEDKPQMDDGAWMGVKGARRLEEKREEAVLTEIKRLCLVVMTGPAHHPAAPSHFCWP